jgi:hypothetical protein
MSVTMQLFSIGDLQQLSAAQLAELSALLGAHTRTPLDDAVRAVRILVATEYQHLTGRRASPFAPLSDPTKGLLDQFFAPEDLAHLTPQTYRIMHLVAECALASHPQAVAALGLEAYKRFEAWTGRTPQGPELPRVLRHAQEEVAP